MASSVMRLPKNTSDRRSEKSLVREYRYLRDDIAVEFRVKLGRAPKRADLAIFPEDTLHKQEHASAIIECKGA